MKYNHGFKHVSVVTKLLLVGPSCIQPELLRQYCKRAIAIANGGNKS